MNSIERSKKIGISSLQLHGQGFSPVCKVRGILDYYAVKSLITLITLILIITIINFILLIRPNIYIAIPQVF